MWAEPKISRSQYVLFAPCLDEIVDTNHVVRQLDLVFKEIDWNQWEKKYDRTKGQPPIHPRLMAGTILYGLMLGIRSSRKLEDATRHRIDFMWYLENKSVDHSTFSKFRKKFRGEIKTLFRQMNHHAVEKEYMKLVELSLDGTRIRSCSSKSGSRTSKYLEKALLEAEAKIEKGLLEMDSQDILNDPKMAKSEELKSEIEQLTKKVDVLKGVLSIAKERDDIRRRKVGVKSKLVSIPVNDPCSYMLKNKEGGFSPNYTPTVCVDKDSGMIVDAGIVKGDAEADCVLEAIKEVKNIYGKIPEIVSCDTGLGSGANQVALEEQGIAVYTPVEHLPNHKNKALRVDLTQPIPKELWPELSYDKKGKVLKKSSFIYDEQKNCYWCPMGKPLDLEKTRMQKNRLGSVSQSCYKCKSCHDCPLAEKCLSKKATSRNITRNEFDACKQRTAERMGTEEGKTIYKRRSHNAETPFGIIKQAMGIRHFFTTGKDSVESEWMWICSALNLKKLLTFMRRHQLTTT